MKNLERPLQLFYNTENPDSKCNWIMDALREGWPNTVIGDRNKDCLSCDAAFWGLIQNNKELIQERDSPSRPAPRCHPGDYYFWDMAYYGRYSRYNNNPCYWRVSCGGLHVDPRFFMYTKSDRLGKWNVDIQKIRRGEYVLVLPSSETMTQYYYGISVSQWLARVEFFVRKYFSTPIKVRYKPRGNGTSGPDALKPGEPTLSDDLSGADIVITCCSTAAVDAMINGVVCFGTGFLDNSFKIDNIAMFARHPTKFIEYYELRRYELLKYLAYHQYTLEEIRSGVAYETLMSIQ